MTLYIELAKWLETNSSHAGDTDYTSASMELNFQPQQTSSCLPITIFNDTTLEFMETFSVSLTTTDDAVTIGPQSALVSILDDTGMRYTRCLHQCLVVNHNCNYNILLYMQL